MFKWLRVLRDLELMPRPFGQDWTHIFLQKFEGNITILVIFFTSLILTHYLFSLKQLYPIFGIY